ncbi:MAG: anti-sigma factor antagonist [Deltaproteobacteria bacterium]|nr:MAG: anti-sigma factor antagonist [Deltaproteobacteria bacterium]
MPKIKKSIIKAGKDIVASTAEGIRKKLLRAVDKGIDLLVLDLNGVAVVDSVGPSLPLSARNSMEKKGGGMRIVNASKDLRRLFEAMRLDRHFEVSPEPTVV